MLYVFLVDTGKMYTLPMGLAVEPVSRLHVELQRLTGIAVEQQVLLISGGDTLERDEDVGKYNAGTDTNPIFLFCLAHVDDKEAIADDNRGEDRSKNYLLDCYDAEQSLLEQELDALWETLDTKVDAALKLGSSQSTLSHRASLASELVSITCKQINLCESVISSQHLQHQGWQAVMANLEDSFTSFLRRASKMSDVYKRYLSNRSSYQELIEAFDDDVAMLHRIPVFNVLINEFNKEYNDNRGNELISGDSNMSLLDWINSRGSHESLEQLADSCYRSVEKLDESLLEKLQSETREASVAVQDSTIKEIRGLSERLQSLEQLLQEAKTLEKEQQDLAQSLIQNQKRASGLKDDSVLPDLCASHRQQLLVMKRNYMDVASIRKRSLKAKEELSENLRIRLQWVVFVQNKMADVGQSVWMHLEELRRLHRKLEIIEQLHAAPSIYVTTVVEIVRRRAFSSQFLKLANQTSQHFDQVHGSETEMRLNFQSKLKKHFLSKLFPGMDDLPPDFAVVKPELFDQNLPTLTLKDVEVLRRLVPDLTSSLQLPSGDQVLTQKSLSKVATDNLEECSADIGSVSVMHTLIHNSNRRSRSRLQNRKKSNHKNDTDTDSEDGKSSNQRVNGSRRKLTRSLDDSCLFLEKNGICENNKVMTTTTTMTTMTTTMTMTEYMPGAASSSTSVDPSSSANTGTNSSSVVPSSCSTSGQRHDVFYGQETRNKLQAFKQELKTLKETVCSSKSILDEEIQRINDALTLRLGQLNFEDSQAIEAKQRLEECNSDLKLKLDSLISDLEAAERAKKQLSQDLEDTKKILDETNAEKLLAIKRMEEKVIAEVAEVKRQQEAEIAKVTADQKSEIEMLREQLGQMLRYKDLEPQLQSLKEELSVRESEMDMLKRKTRLLEGSQEERFSAEKEKILHILEAGFAQREKLAVMKSAEALEEAHKAKLEELEKNFGHRLQQEELRVKEELSMAHKSTVDLLMRKKAQEIEEALAEQKEVLEREHKASLANQEEIWKRKIRQEVETLRNRFKMMQTTGAFDRSPSTSEPELALEQQSPRQMELAESLRRTLMNEYECALRSERQRWESKVEQMESEHKVAMEQLKSQSRNKDIAEQQVSYNEALKRVTEEKERELRTLRKENEELKNRLTSSPSSQMMLSTFVVDEPGMNRSGSTSDMQRLRAENDQLKAQLTTSMTTLVDSGKVSVRSLEKGEKVLVIWSEEHNNFAIFNESNTLVFLHCESLKELDLLDDNGRPKRRHVTAEVVHKEYCQAKKSDNRYRVPQGTRFYRVKCRLADQNEFI